MGRISTDQSHQVLATLALNTDWTAIDFAEADLQNLIIRDPKEAGRQFTLFLKNGGRLSEPVCRWNKRNGVIHFSVTSKGMTGGQWFTHFAEKRVLINQFAKETLLSEDFKPTIETYQVAVIKGESFSDEERLSNNIRMDAFGRGMNTPNLEIACLIRDKFSDEEIKEMGLKCILIMHTPVKDSEGDSSLLSVDWDRDGSYLSTHIESVTEGWEQKCGFAFVI